MIEAHVYERLLKDIDELPKTVIQTWQPYKAIKLLSEFDDLADKDLRIELSDNTNKEIVEIHYNNLSIKKISKIYNSLGSYLHLPTPEKISNYSIKKSKILKLLNSLERLTAGNLIIVKVPYDSFKCTSCGKHIVYTRKYVENNETIMCQNDACKIEYQVKVEKDKVSFGSEYVFECGICKNEASVQFSKIEDGYQFSCKSCGTLYTFELILRGVEQFQHKVNKSINSD